MVQSNDLRIGASRASLRSASPLAEQASARLAPVGPGRPPRPRRPPVPTLHTHHRPVGAPTRKDHSCGSTHTSSSSSPAIATRHCAVRPAHRDCGATAEHISDIIDNEVARRNHVPSSAHRHDELRWADDERPRPQPRSRTRPRHRERRPGRVALGGPRRQARRRRCRSRRDAHRACPPSRWTASSSSARARRTKRRCCTTASTSATAARRRSTSRSTRSTAPA